MSRPSRITRAALLALVVGTAACGRQGLDLLEGVGGSAGVSGAAGTTGNAGTTGAAGTTGFAGSGGTDPTLPLASTPNRIRCGDRTCPVETDYCCSSAQYMGDLTSAEFKMCSASFCGIRRECDETADCLGGELCCYSVFASPPAVIGSTCVPKDQCRFEQTWIACGSQRDCQAAGAGACVAQPCGGATLQTCGPISRTYCKN